MTTTLTGDEEILAAAERSYYDDLEFHARVENALATFESALGRTLDFASAVGIRMAVSVALSLEDWGER